MIKVVKIVGVAALFGIFCFFGLGGRVAHAATVINSCQAITQPGSYTLGNNLIASPNVNCINIFNTSNVQLDCGGFGITSQSNNPDIDVLNTSNYSISNCKFSFNPTEVRDNGVFLQQSPSGTIANNTFTGASLFGEMSDNLSVINNFSTGEFEFDNGNNENISSNTISLAPGVLWPAGIWIYNSSGDTIAGNQINGNWNGMPISTAPDDGIVAAYVSSSIIQNNTISNVFDTGIENVGLVQGTKFLNNKISNTGYSGIGGWVYDSFQGNTISGNVASSSSGLFGFFYSCPADGFGVNCLPDGQSSVYFQNNIFSNNSFFSPLQPADFPNPNGISELNTINTHIDLFDSLPISSTLVVAGNNIFTGNNFNLQAAAPLLAPSSSMVDGGGNICSTFPSTYPIPIHCSGSTAVHPTDPVLTSGVAVSPTQDNLTWTASTDAPGVASYEIIRLTSGYPFLIATVPSNVLSYSDTNLAPYARFEYWIIAIDSAGNYSGPSNPKFVSETTQPPTTPTLLSAAVISPTQVNLTWTASTDAIGLTGYLIRRIDSSNNINLFYVSSSTLSYSDVIAVPNTTYSYEVTAYDPAGNYSPWSNILQVTMPSADTQPPTVSISSPANGATVSGVITISGTASDNFGVASVILSIDGGSYVAVSGTTSWTYSLNTTSLANGSHQIIVNAADSSGNSSSTSIVMTVNNSASTSPPSTPTGLSASNVTTSTISLTWNSSSQGTYPIAGYTIFRNGSQVASTTTNSYVDTNLTPSSTYTYAVSAYDTQGNSSALSSPITVTTSQVTNIIPPTVLITSPVNGATVSGTITVSGTASSTIAVSSIAISIDGGSYITVSGITSWSYPLNTTSLANGSHSITAKATDSLGNTATASVTVNVNNTVTVNPPTVPTGFTPPTVTTSTVSLIWYPSSQGTYPIAGYTIFRNGSQVASTTTNSYVDTNLTPSSTYTYAVSTHDTQGNSSALSSPITVTTMQTVGTTPPSTPTGFTAPSVNTSTVSLVWQPSNPGTYPVAGYTIFRNGSQVASTSLNSYADANLTPNFTYTYAVSARDTQGNSSTLSSPITVTTMPLTNTPTTPTMQSATAISPNQVNLAWTASTDSEGIAEYEIQRSDYNLFYTSSTVTSYSDTSAAPNTTYGYRVTARDNAGNYSPWSNSLQVTTPSTNTQPPTVSISSPLNGATVSGTTTISGSASDVYASISSVAISVDGGSYIPASGIASWSYSLNTNGLSNGTHSLEAQATDSSGNIGLSSIVTVTVNNTVAVTPPSSPTGLSASNVTTSTISLTWNSSSQGTYPVAGYYVLRNGNQAANISGTIYTDINLSPSSIYTYTVSAYDSMNNNSAPSVPLTVSTNVNTTPPSAPTGLTTISASTSTISFLWNASTQGSYPVAGYTIYRNGSPINNTSNASYMDAGLTASTTYTYTVTAYDGQGNTSSQSAPLVAATQSQPQPQPIIFITTPANGSTISGTFKISGTATSSHTLASVQISIDGGAYVAATGKAAWTYSWNTIGVSNGTHTITAKVTDSIGNTNTATVTIIVSNVVVPPTVPTALTQTTITTSTAAFSWVASTKGTYPIAGYKIYRTSVQVGTTTAKSYKDTGLAASTTYTYTVSAYDTMGNTSAQSTPLLETTKSLPDHIPPSISITYPSNGVTISGTVTISGAATDNVAVASVAISIDGGAYANASGINPWNYAWNSSGVSNGIHTITAKALDSSNNASTTKIKVTVGNSSSQSAITIGSTPSSVGQVAGASISSVASNTPNISKASQAAEAVREGVPLGALSLENFLNQQNATVAKGLMRNLTTGSTGQDVRQLQILLNNNGYLVAVRGAGSPGKETTYFGPNTGSALAKFQKADGLKPTGIFDGKTRSYLLSASTQVGDGD